ncbi:MAG: hypothetical protein GXO47_11490 [Chlorobi bacterium]|nr:hypothetical protein [Chlorobiota bacterium]
MRLLFFILLLLYGINAGAQVASANLTTGYGRNLHYKDDIRLYNLTFSLLEHKEKNNDWMVFYGHPRIGYFFSYTDYSSGGYSTSSYSAYPAVIFKGNTRLSYETLVGAGLSYFSSVDVPFLSENEYLATKLDWLFVISAKLLYHTNRFNFYTGFNIAHNSNASVKLPNNGLNTLSGVFGVEYRFRDIKKDEKVKTKKDLIFKKYPFNVEFEFGVGPKYLLYNTTDFLFEKNAAIFSGALFLARRYKFFKPRFGLRITDYKSHSREYHDHVNYIVMGGNDFIFGKMSIMLNIGYLVNKNNALLPWNTTLSGFDVHLYEQLGIVFNIKDFGIGGRLNARADASEYMELFLKYNLSVGRK